MATPSTPWISGKSVTEIWTSESGDPASFALVMNGNDETLLIEESVPTSLGAYTFTVPNVTGWVVQHFTCPLILTAARVRFNSACLIGNGRSLQRTLESMWSYPVD